MKTNIHQLPVSERPRERLQLAGAGQLSDQEQLAILLGSGSSQQPVLALSEKLLAEANGLQNLTSLDFDKLCKIKGIGPAKATIIIAAGELGRRTFSPAKAKIRIASEADAIRHFGHLFWQPDQLRYLLVLLDRQNDLLATSEFSEMPDLQNILQLVKDSGAHSFGLLRNAAADEPQFAQIEQAWLDDLRAAAAMLRVRFHNLLVVQPGLAVAPG